MGVKLDIERVPADSKWLFYSQQEQPVPEDDWLLDVRMRAKPFHVDEASIQLEELDLSISTEKDLECIHLASGVSARHACGTTGASLSFAFGCRGSRLPS
ncbi:hypothetical protein [Iodobacter ciconiae]|uniref:Uncharacterized protein n=1 Tax=Iodobacter ciconiae TaxID=2496266 RepID=A0A3S8ZQW9_9NEIS|nr:hypothetical protein [Iodobacter ciconiae]AZN35881.1 hypothetical protein EJO50_04910 [Iodobacter ciconiae]